MQNTAPVAMSAGYSQGVLGLLGVQRVQVVRGLQLLLVFRLHHPHHLLHQYLLGQVDPGVQMVLGHQLDPTHRWRR